MVGCVYAFGGFINPASAFDGAACPADDGDEACRCHGACGYALGVGELAACDGVYACRRPDGVIKAAEFSGKCFDAVPCFFIPWFVLFGFDSGLFRFDFGFFCGDFVADFLGFLLLLLVGFDGFLYVFPDLVDGVGLIGFDVEIHRLDGTAFGGGVHDSHIALLDDSDGTGLSRVGFLIGGIKILYSRNRFTSFRVRFFHIGVEGFCGESGEGNQIVNRFKNLLEIAVLRFDHRFTVF
nr:hypothetical protein [Metabacillus flavus]